MKEIVYVSIRNVKLGASAGNFGKPILLDKLIEEASIEEVLEMSEEGNTRFFDENGDDIEIDQALKYLKMIISNMQVEKAEELAPNLLLVYNEHDQKLAEEISSALSDEYFETQSLAFRLDQLKAFAAALKPATAVGFVMGPHFQAYLSTTMVAYLITLTQKKQPVLIKAEDVAIDINTTSLMDQLSQAIMNTDENSRAFKVLDMTTKRLEQLSTTFKKNVSIRSHQIEEIAAFV